MLINGAGIASAAAVISETPNPVAVNGTITVTWSGVTGQTVKDWYGVFHHTDSDTATANAWAYDSSCTQTSGATAKASGTCSLGLGSGVAAGTDYEMRLYTNDSNTRIATGSIFTVGAAATSTPTPTSTPVPPTATPTATSIPPTDTPTSVPATATPTSTSIPATATPTTTIPTATPTIGPTATSVPLGAWACDNPGANPATGDTTDNYITAQNTYQICLQNATSVALSTNSLAVQAAQATQAAVVATSQAAKTATPTLGPTPAAIATQTGCMQNQSDSNSYHTCVIEDASTRSNSYTFWAIPATFFAVLVFGVVRNGGRFGRD